MVGPLAPVALAEIEAARLRLHGIAIRTPLVRLGLPDASPQILLKLENLQPIGSFKLRGAANAMARAGREALAQGVPFPAMTEASANGWMKSPSIPG